MKLLEKDPEIKFNFAVKQKSYILHKEPVPHIVVESKKKLHGWWNSIKDKGKRACTSERFLINPYNGCSWNCFFCYAHALWGYFNLFQKKKIITVFKNYDKIIDHQIKNLLIGACGYISPITDPFQPINTKYHLTEKIMNVFLKYDLPIEISTKGIISKEALKILAQHPYNHSFAQVSLLTLNDDLRKKLILGKGATSNQLLRNIERLADQKIHCVCRIDPIIPYINDDIKQIKNIINAAIQAGAKHIGVSILDIPIFIKNEILNNLIEIKGKHIRKKYKKLYTEKITSDLHADINYRKKILKKIKKYCIENEITMSTCMEFEKISTNGKIYFKSLNKNHEFMTSDNCEGINVPIYERSSLKDKFRPIKCEGNCLYCRKDPVPCRIPQLKKGMALKLDNYEKWSEIKRKNTFKNLTEF
jgi:DNA repair photolyase